MESYIMSEFTCHTYKGLVPINIFEALNGVLAETIKIQEFTFSKIMYSTRLHSENHKTN